MIYTGGDGDDKTMGMGRGWDSLAGMGRGWGRTNGDAVAMGAAPTGTACGRRKNSWDGVGMGMKFITVSFST